MTEGDSGQPWWESNVIVASVILGLPVVGLISNGVLSLIGINTSEFPDMFSTGFFMTDLFLKLLSLPIGVVMIRTLMRRMNVE